jgi:ComF family protein
MLTSAIIADWRSVFSSTGDRTRADSVVAATVRPNFVSLMGSLFSTLFPSDCRLCGAPLTNVSRVPVCESCLCSILPISVPQCCVCGEVLPLRYEFTQGEARCADCSVDPPLFARAVAYGAYDTGLREMIHLLKYGQVRPASNVLGRMLAEVIEPLDGDWEGRVPVVIPVPLHAEKMRQRGFNQSELVAGAALRCLRRKGLMPELSLNITTLIRRRATASQVGMSVEQRQANIRGAFKVLRPDQVAQRDVLLVDDVFTTGATVSECTRVLRRAGAVNVYVATVARALKRTEQSVEPMQQREESVLTRSAHA